MFQIIVVAVSPLLITDWPASHGISQLMHHEMQMILKSADISALLRYTRHMFWLDIAILIWLLVALVMGTRAGFVYAAGKLVGLVVGIWLAGRWTPQLASAFGTNVLVTVVIFLVLLSLLTKIGGLFAWFLDKAFKILTIIPFLKTFNKVFGGVLGLLISVAILSMGILSVQLFATGTPIADTVDQSRVATQVGKWSAAYRFLLPDQWQAGSVSVDAMNEDEPVEAKKKTKESDATDSKANQATEKEVEEKAEPEQQNVQQDIQQFNDDIELLEI